MPLISFDHQRRQASAAVISGCKPQYMKTIAYNIKIAKGEDGYFFVTVPALPGCFTQGKTYEEALLAATEAIEGYLIALAKAHQPIPEDKPPRLAVSGWIRVKAPTMA